MQANTPGGQFQPPPENPDGAYYRRQAAMAAVMASRAKQN